MFSVRMINIIIDSSESREENDTKSKYLQTDY